ncbi:MAG: hypothetical protein O2807_05610 [bacterium]|nr:hypothetical protein [bacterium]
MKKDIWKSVAGGLAGTAALLGLFFGALTVVSNFDYALREFERLRVWVLLLAAGFGVQVALYLHVRFRVRESIRGATAEVAATGGISAGSMVACCAHYVTSALPLLGLSALSVFVTKYQTSFFLVGIFSNLIGMSYMLYFLQKHGLMPQVFPAAAVSRCNMKTVRNAVIAVSVSVVAASFFWD